MKKFIINKKATKKQLSDLELRIKKGKYKNFHTHDVLGSNCADFYFINNDQLFNCAIGSLKGRYMEKVHDIVYDKVKEMYPKYYDYHFGEPDKDGSCQMFFDSPYKQEDVKEYEDNICEQICSEGSITVRETIEFDSSYEYGIGTIIYLNLERFKEVNIQKIIKIIKSLPVIYEGEIFLGDLKSFKYEECKKHIMMGTAIEMEDIQ